MIYLIDIFVLALFAILFFAFQRISNAKSRDSLIMVILLSFVLPFVKPPLHITNPQFLRNYVQSLAYFLLHVGLGGMIGIVIEKLS